MGNFTVAHTTEEPVAFRSPESGRGDKVRRVEKRGFTHVFGTVERRVLRECKKIEVDKLLGKVVIRKASGAFDMFDLEQFGRLIRCQGSQINVAPNPIAVYRTTIEVYHTDRTKVKAQIYTS
jgi:hypothetical protein